MLDAIQELASSRSDEENEHLAVYNYLKHCNLLFESGILSHAPIAHISSPVLTNIQQGFEYFKNWKDSF
jgi:hypothetical protein